MQTAYLLESAVSKLCVSGRLSFPQRSCRKRRMTNLSVLPNAPSAERFERMYPDNEACAANRLEPRGPGPDACGLPFGSDPSVVGLRQGRRRERNIMVKIQKLITRLEPLSAEKSDGILDCFRSGACPRNEFAAP